MMLKTLFVHLYPYLKQQKLNVFIVCIAVLMVSASLLLVGTTVKQFLDLVTSRVDLPSIYKQIAYTFLIILWFASASFLRSYRLGILNEAIIADIRIRIYSALMAKQSFYIERNNVTAMLNLINKGLTLVEQVISNIFSFLLRNIILFCVSSILMFYQNQELATIFFIALPLITLPLMLLNRILKKYNIAFQSHSNQLAIFFEESLNNFKVIKVFNQQQRLVHQFITLNGTITNAQNIRQKFRSIFFGLILLLLLSFILGIVFWGTLEVANNTIATGSLVAFIFYSILMSSSLIGIMEPLALISTQITGINELFALIDNQDIETDTTQIIAEQSIVKNEKAIIKIQNLYFKYIPNTYSYNLSNISFTVTRGEFIGITGPSGSGKSTLIKLLLNLYPGKYKGTIEIFNEACVSYVPQESMLFSLSIKDNIMFGAPNLSNEKLAEIIKITAIEDIISQYGLDSPLDNKASTLSGGQKQQVALARALAVNPEILICDEATSAMDFNLERKILHNLQNYMTHKTIIFVAHRLNSIKDADKIIVMDQGKITSIGNHAELISSCRLYQELNNSTNDTI